MCGSDVHTLSQGWGESKLPLVAGHEIVGHVTRVGNKVTEFKVGQRVGVGAQIASCMQCRACKEGYENYCPDELDTYVCAPSRTLHMTIPINKHCNDRTASTTTVLPLRAGTLPPFARISALSSQSRTRSSPRTPRRCSAPASPCTRPSRRTAVVRVRRSVLLASEDWATTPSSGRRRWARRCTPSRSSRRSLTTSSRWARTTSLTLGRRY